MKISAVSCILGIINTLAAYSRGVPYIECMMESVFCILLSSSIHHELFSRASCSWMLKQRAKRVCSGKQLADLLCRVSLESKHANLSNNSSCGGAA